MDRKSLLGASFDCDCGKHHHVPTKYYFYGNEVLTSFKQTLAETSQGKNYLIIADARTWDAAGKKVMDSLTEQGCYVDKLIVPDKGDEWPAADDSTKDYLLANAPEADIYIAAGSGVINDLVKWVSFLRKTPFVTVPTAASMNGYGSANVAATVEGLKVLFHADACKAVFAVPEIINNAPAELTTSGLGDVLAKSVSSADWKLNRFLFNDYYCQFSVDLLKDLEPVYLNNPQGVRDKDPEALRALFDALFYSSMAMTITGTSSPASGGEHLISHTLDMLALRDGTLHDLHGRQVGVGSILTAAIYEQVMDIENPQFTEPPQKVNHQFWGALTPVVEKEYDKKLDRIKEVTAFLSIPENWEQLRAHLKPDLISAAKLKECLRVAGGAHRYVDINFDGKPLDRDTFTGVALHANQMRQRFTILDLATLLGVIPSSINLLIDRYLND